MELILFGLLAVLLIFMIFNSRKRAKQMKADREEKARKTIPGAKVLMQGGIFGTIVAFNPEDLDEPALVEIAPGTVIEVHSQAILRIVEPKDTVAGDEADDVDAVSDAVADAPAIETAEETRARLDGDANNK